MSVFITTQSTHPEHDCCDCREQVDFAISTIRCTGATEATNQDTKRIDGEVQVVHSATVKRFEVESKVHDGMLFYWSPVAFKTNWEVIGFYFDRAGIPRQILRGTTYGLNIERWESERRPS